MPTKPMAADQPLNTKQRKFVRRLVATGSVKDAALDVGYNPDYGSWLKAQPNVQNEIQTVMERRGITDDYLMRKLKQGLNAKYPAKKSKDGATLVEAVPDHLNRRGYLDMAFKLKGSYAPEKTQHEEKKIVVNLNLGTVKGLVDSGAITEIEAEQLKALPQAKSDE